LEPKAINKTALTPKEAKHEAGYYAEISVTGGIFSYYENPFDHKLEAVFYMPIDLKNCNDLNEPKLVRLYAKPYSVMNHQFGYKFWYKCESDGQDFWNNIDQYSHLAFDPEEKVAIRTKLEMESKGDDELNKRCGTHHARFFDELY